MEALRQLPSVDVLLNEEAVLGLVADWGRETVASWCRAALDGLREDLRARSDPTPRASLVEELIVQVENRARHARNVALGPVVNATGVVLHTNLGRAPLADGAVAAMTRAAHYTNLEVDLESGKRSHRGSQLDDLWRGLTGAEASLIVNNCAAATVLALQALAMGREVVVSRGQLIEIGGSYRLPEIFRQSGAILREIGTTNRTHARDYENAITPNTAALLRVHPSNFRVMGFTEEVPIGEIVEIARRQQILAIDDIGSGCLLDLTPYGLRDEPTVGQSLARGADLVLFSGDKLLGGPQCGVLLGRAEIIQRISQCPLARAVRVDKLTLAALQGTLEIYRNGNPLQEIPVLRMLTQSADILRQRALKLTLELQEFSAFHCQAQPGMSAVGGGSLPMVELPTWVITVSHETWPAHQLAQYLRTGSPRLMARVENDLLILDPRTVLPHEESQLRAALGNLSK